MANVKYYPEDVLVEKVQSGESDFTTESTEAT